MNKLKVLIKGLVVASSIGLTQQVSAVVVHTHQTQAPQVHQHQAVASDAEQQTMILYYVNAYREKHHLAPLQMNRVISREATKHSRDMASHAMPFGHNEFNGRIKRLYQQIRECRGGAENVAYYRINDKKLVDGWIASRGHRQNILGGYNLTGIGIAHGKTGWAYYTQIFLRSDSNQVG